MSQANMSHDSLSKNFEMQYDGVQQLDQNSINQFTKKGKGNLGPVCAKIVQPYVSQLTL